MKQVFSGWAAGLVKAGARDGERTRYFLGVLGASRETAKFGDLSESPLDPAVFRNLFGSEGEAMDFWKGCRWANVAPKSLFAAFPVKVELSVEVASLGFGWRGI